MKKLLILITTLLIVPAAIVFGYGEFHHRNQKVVRHAKVYRAPAPQTLEAKINRFQLATQKRLVALNGRLDSLIDQARQNEPKQVATKRARKSKKVREAKADENGPTLGRELRALDNRVWMARWDLLELDDATESSWPAEKKLTENYVTDLEHRVDALETRVRSGQPASTNLGKVARLMREERTPNGLVLMPDPNPIPIVSPTAKPYVEVLAEKEKAREKHNRKLSRKSATRLAAKRATPRKANKHATNAGVVVKATAAKNAPAKAKTATKVAKAAEPAKPIAAPTLDLADRTSLNQTFLDPFGLEPDRDVASDLSLQMSLAKDVGSNENAQTRSSKADATSPKTNGTDQANPASLAPKASKAPRETQEVVTSPEPNAPVSSPGSSGTQR